MTQHTPLSREETNPLILLDSDGAFFASTVPDKLPGGSEFVEEYGKASDRARLIVKACNHHEALVEALRLILPLAKGYAALNKVGSNAEYVSTAEAVLSAIEETK